MDLNLVVLRGRIAVDPEIRTFDSGATLARFLITTRTDEPKRTDVVPVTVWEPPPEMAAIQRGDRVWAAGSVQRRFWNGPDGRKSRLEVVAQQIESRPREEEDPDEGAEASS